MKFNKTLNASIIKEWRFYSVDYKQMKKTLKEDPQNSSTSLGIDSDEYFRLYDTSKSKLTKFYNDKEQWAISYYKTMEERVDALRSVQVSSQQSHKAGEGRKHPVTSDSASSSIASASDSEDEEMFVDLGAVNSNDNSMSSFSKDFGTRITVVPEPDASASRSQLHTDDKEMTLVSPASSAVGVENHESLKEEYRTVGKSEHFQNYIYAKKSLDTFARELDLLLDFLHLNQTAFSKILKKYDKRSGSSIREKYLADLRVSHAYLNGDKLKELKGGVFGMLEKVASLKPVLPEGWEDRKVYTIGCFDLFHRGHQNVLKSLREFGYFIVAGIHDDESYFKLKNKYTIDNLETRMRNVKPFVDQIYVIPSTDPELYLKSMVSEQDIEAGTCCYARGDDMLKFPGREWVESVMPVHFVPRTESCSSTLIRTIYHSEDPEIRKRAAYAQTRYDGKPVDEEGNVLKF
eukprot:CAMPEP_0197261192 /NCGR_PEP_ID=MMETSP1429-20130617/84419_1 /TAXON_ID=49237 /ORGANISM="Chaetoceros  sp., Strain UNC1202" /LENGTH=460 /DNA_ID=CAMNT_0042725449 /DNA_START=39 /DNA_END=1421 /DNA_ORIENTATION=-